MKLFPIVIAFCLLGISKTADAQEFSIAADAVIPTGDFSDGWGLGGGATLRFEKAVGKRTSWITTAGGAYTPGKNLYGFKVPGVTFIPFQTGIKYYFEELMKGFYVSGEGGFHHIIVSHASGSVNGISYDFPSQSETDFSFAPGIGMHTANGDIGFRYNIITPSSGPNLTYFGIRIAAILR